MIEIKTHNEASRALWEGVAELVEVLPTGWVLVGGLMVQLHVLEHDLGDIRVTVDIDVLGQARPQGALKEIDAALLTAGFHAHDVDADNFAHRYERDELIVDVLAPDGIRPPPTLDGSRLAVGIPGGSQALARSEAVAVILDGREFAVRRPTLLGAILIKARALPKHHDPDAQREDLLRLLSLVKDPRQTAAELKNSERRWLRKAEPLLELDGGTALSVDTVRLARQTLSLLLSARG